jgi:hypothetical protein
MARRNAPYFRTSLRALPDRWTGGPGMSFPIVRFAVWTTWLIAPVDGQQEQDLHAQPSPPPPASLSRPELALVLPEVAYSVLPFSVRQARRIAYDPQPPLAWQGRPAPYWRGIPTTLGSTWIGLLNEQQAAPAWEPFRILVLLPDRDPAGPRPEFPVLGSDFLLHYRVRVGMDYSAIPFLHDPATGKRRVDPRGRCGWLEID